MSPKRPLVLTAILAAMLAGCVAWPHAHGWYQARATHASEPLPAANGLSALTVTRLSEDRWRVAVSYAYTGKPAGAQLRIFQGVVAPDDGGVKSADWLVGSIEALPGRHRYSVDLRNPDPEALTATEKVIAQLEAPSQPALAKLALDHRIAWPDPVVAQVERALAVGRPEIIVQQAAALIDSARLGDLGRARALLQALLKKSPESHAAHVELARVAIKTNWSPTGLREAEGLVTSALELRPDSADAKILLGYVYAHQGRHKDAENLFTEAAGDNPPNLWLWTNWGEVLAMQGKDAAAIEKFREAVVRPPTGDGHDRARWSAYAHLQRLLAARDDLDGMQALLEQQAGEYKGAKCFAVDHARFLVLYRGQVDTALALVRDTPSPQCDPNRLRELQGLALYMAWAQGQEPHRAEALRQARALLPVGPELFYTLAASDRGMAVAQQLVRTGEKVAVQDSGQMDALAYALRKGEGTVTRRLLMLGASPLAEVGPEHMPAALIPVLARDFEGIRILLRAGVDYSKVQYRGASGLEHAKSRRDARLQRLLEARSL